MDKALLKRVNVIGTSGSGKSTFAKKLSNVLDVPYIELDEIFWKPNWVESRDEEFFSNIESALNQEKWVLDGNYTRSIPIKWKNVTSIIWIDYSFSRTLYQALKRAFKRIFSNQEIWKNTGNKETFKKTFLSRDSIILWTLKTYKKNKINYAKLPKNFPHIHFIRITSPKQAQIFINEVKI